MRLEVLTEAKGGAIYVLNRPEIYIGSSENNDIVITSGEISKKHLKLIVTDDNKCFIIDQGSTNGTFLNDERLIPGRREEFPMMSSVRLGNKVLLTLLDKDRGDLPEIPLRDRFVEENKMKIPDEDKTRVISLKTLQKTKTEKVKKKRLKKLEKEIKKKKIQRQDKKTLNNAIITALIIIGVGYGAMKAIEARRKRNARTTIISKVKETRLMVDDTIESLEENAADLIIPNSVLLSSAEISKHIDDVNCALTDEIFFCKRMPRDAKKNGAVSVNGNIIIYLEEKPWMKRAQSLVAYHQALNADKHLSAELEKKMEKADEADEEGSPPKPATPDEGVSMDLLHRIGYLSYFKDYLSRGLTAELKGNNYYFVFYNKVGEQTQIERVLAIRGTLIEKVNTRYTEDFFRFKKYDPYKIIKKLDRFYRVF